MRPLKKRSDSSERREWQRIPIPIPVYIRTLAEPDKTISEFTTAVNVSAGGALIATRRYLHSGLRLSLEVPPAPFPDSSGLPSNERTFSAESVRVTAVESYYLIGVRFDRALATGSEKINNQQ